MLASLIALVFGYLCGSIPSGVIVTRLAGADDPRGIGSKNIGATNVLRTGRKDLAAATLLADVLKGAVPVLICAYADSGSGPLPLAPAAALGAFFGHLFPVFLGFRGGKGVATYFGCLIAIAWPAAIAFAIVWLTAAFLTRYSSVGALSASLVTPGTLFALGEDSAALLFLVLTATLWITHRANIARLLAGSETKIGQKSRVPAS